MFKTLLENRWIQAAGLLAVVCLLALLFYALSPVLVTVFFAFLVAYVLNPVVDFMERHRVPRPLTISTLAGLALVAVISLPLMLVPYIVNQADRLTRIDIHEAPEGRVAQWVDYAADRLPLDDLVRHLGWADPQATDVEAREVIAERIGVYVKDSALGFVRQQAENLLVTGQRAGSTAAAVFGQVWRWVVTFLFFAGNAALFCFVVGYLLNDFHKIIATTQDLIPHKWRPRVLDIVGKIDLQVHSFLRGELLVCVILSVLYGTGYTVAKVPFAIPIAIIGGLGAFVPYVGATIAVVPALLLAVLEHGAQWPVVGVLVTFVVAQSLEGYILTPNIVGREVGLSPLWVILSLMVFTTLMGFLGMLLAVPVAAALKVLVVEALAAYKRSALFDAPVPAEDKAGT